MHLDISASTTNEKFLCLQKFLSMEANSTVDLSVVVPPSLPASSQSLSFSIFILEWDGTLGCQFYLPQNANLAQEQHFMMWMNVCSSSLIFFLSIL